MLDPTCAMVGVYIKMFDAKLTKIKFSSDLFLPFEKLISKISEDTRMVLLLTQTNRQGQY